MLTRVSLLWRRWRDAGWGVLAQALTLLATFLPVVWGAGDSLVVLVVATAVATICTPIATLAAQYHVPLSVSPRALMEQLSVSALSTVATASAVGLIASALASSLNSPMGFEWGLAIGALTAAQGFFTLAVSTLVRASAYRELMLARLAYGACTLVFTLTALLIGGGGLALAGAAAGGFLIGAASAAALGVRIARARAVPLPRPSLAHAQEHIRASCSLALSGAVGAVAGQFAALLTPVLGPAGPAWAAAIRVMSGFQTVGVIIFGSAIDSRFAASRRIRDARALHQIARRAELLGVVLGVSGAAASAVAATMTGNPGAQHAWLFFASLALVCGTNIALAPIGRLLGLTGTGTARLFWDIGRCITFSVAFIVPGHFALMTLGGASVLGYAVYIFLLRGALRSVTQDGKPK